MTAKCRFVYNISLYFLLVLHGCGYRQIDLYYQNEETEINNYRLSLEDECRHYDKSMIHESFSYLQLSEDIYDKWRGCFEATTIGLQVDSVFKGSPADKAKVKKGDIIRQINGQKAFSIHQLGEAPPHSLKLLISSKNLEREISFTREEPLSALGLSLRTIPKKQVSSADSFQECGSRIGELVISRFAFHYRLADFSEILLRAKAYPTHFNDLPLPARPSDWLERMIYDASIFSLEFETQLRASHNAKLDTIRQQCFLKVGEWHTQALQTIKQNRQADISAYNTQLQQALLHFSNALNQTLTQHQLSQIKNQLNDIQQKTSNPIENKSNRGLLPINP